VNADRLGWAERVLGTLGILFLGAYGFLYLDGTVQSRAALDELKAESARLDLSHQSEAGQSRPVDAADKFAPSLPRTPGVSTGLLSSKLAIRRNSAVAELRLPRLELDIPVFRNTSRTSLNRGAGWIAGTAAPWGRDGTVGIAGHRDRFFRSLKQIVRGDEILLATRTQTQTFIVDGIAIVTPGNTSLLRDGTRRSLALVTCYPFSYIGPAPKRFVVHAQLKQEVENSQPSGAQHELAPGRAQSLF
jgi:sortase A